MVRPQELWSKEVTVPHRLVEVLNLNCQTGQHAKCPATSKGSKSDPVTFVCSCSCHKDRLRSDESRKFVVGCRVSGGVTGTRQSVLKVNGEVLYFASRQEAEERAKQLNREMNNAYAVAFFEYWAEEA